MTSRSKTIVARASCRVDLAGGTLDLWPLYLFHPGAVTVNFALDVMTSCRITPNRSGEIHLRSLDTGKLDRFASTSELLKSRSYKHPLAGYLCRFFLTEGTTGFSLDTHSDSPAGAGISGSSALMIATTAALARFTGRKLSKEAIRVIAQNVEAQLIRVPTGCQDYYPALYGGVSAIHLAPDGIHRESIAVPATEVDSRFVLVYTGAPRQSGINNWEVFKAHINGDKRIFRNFADISSIAQAMRSALLKPDWSEVAHLLREEWKLRKTNAPGITTPLIEKLVSAAMKNGARAAKVCGAGGGGCAIFLVDPESKQRVADELTATGGQVLPFKLARRGLSVQVE
ncbi:MAG: kinase [Candidatus Angelobacter sp.]|jgi:D-glycero-alpha-D-manno-heptose-7-phosphate kinase|nr:kinase [Candidatus Angelobacter sp.]